jgi:hypothetical protein
LGCFREPESWPSTARGSTCARTRGGGAFIQEPQSLTPITGLVGTCAAKELGYLLKYVLQEGTCGRQKARSLKSRGACLYGDVLSFLGSGVFLLIISDHDARFKPLSPLQGHGMLAVYALESEALK